MTSITTTTRHPEVILLNHSEETEKKKGVIRLTIESGLLELKDSSEHSLNILDFIDYCIQEFGTYNYADLVEVFTNFRAKVESSTQNRETQIELLHNFIRDNNTIFQGVSVNGVSGQVRTIIADILNPKNPT